MTKNRNRKEVTDLGTNYYMMTNNKELVNRYFSGEYGIVDSPYLGYEIHIGKRSCGWKPLFQEHRQAYNSVKEMISFIESHSDFRIFDEYNREFCITGLMEELINWGDQQEKKIIHYDDYVGDIQSPIDHIEIASRDHRNHLYGIRYWHDKDGYDFTDREFT